MEPQFFALQADSLSLWWLWFSNSKIVTEQKIININKLPPELAVYLYITYRPASQHFMSGGHLKFKIHRAWSFYNLMKIAEYIYSARTGGLRGREVYILRTDGKC
jgi:hypothetical protein